MKKNLIVIALLGIAVLTFGAVGYVYAQTQTPPEPGYPYGHEIMGDYIGHGQGMMGYGFGWMGENYQEGPMHETMVVALAEALDLDPAEIEARHEAGESLWEIAADTGLSDEEIRELMDSAHNSALEEAVTSGLLSPEQAEWMEEHMEWMWSGEGEYNGFGGHCSDGSRFDNNTDWRGMSY